MSKQNYEVGRSSSATHRLTQASMTLDRRYVHRPGNLAIEEAAREAEKAAAIKAAQSAPSRLVNLGVRRAELEAAQRAKNRVLQEAEAKSPKFKENKATPKPITIFSNVIEMGREDDQKESIAIDFTSNEKLEEVQNNSNSPRTRGDDFQDQSEAVSPIALTAPSLAPPPITSPEMQASAPQSETYTPAESEPLRVNHETETMAYTMNAARMTQQIPALEAANPDCSDYAMQNPGDALPTENTYNKDSYYSEQMSDSNFTSNSMQDPTTPNESTCNLPTSETSEYYTPMNGVAASDVMNMAPAAAVAVSGATENSQHAMDQSELAMDQSELAMNIAADYAAASLGASVAEYGNNYQGYAMSEPNGNEPSNLNLAIDRAQHSPSSVEEIARTAANAIAAIHLATDPNDIAEQITSLKAFSEKIQAESVAPEIQELSDTIDKFVSVAMKSTSVKEAIERKEAAANAKTASVSIKSNPKPAVKPNKTTLSRGATRAAAKVTRSSAKAMAASRVNNSNPTLSANNRQVVLARSKAIPAKSNMQRPTAAKRQSMGQKTATDRERALRQTMRSVATMNNSPTDSTRSQKKREVERNHKKSGGKRFLIAFGCATACVGAFFYLVSSNMPDISVRVAAMQTGIEASYPSYVPRGYSLGDVASEDGKISMNFKGPDDASFILIEEKSSWDSVALERNFVKPTWGDKYSTTHEQGITIYISGSDAAWVNAGILYKISSKNDNLTKKQLRNIVVSL